MTYDSTLFGSTQVHLEIDPNLQAQAWQRSQCFATSLSQWNAYLNDLCLNTILAWLHDDYDPEAMASPNPIALASMWEFVNGFSIVLQGVRLVLIPTEAIDTDELRVPQEWVDLPSWVGDYYLSVQVNPDAAWVRINGFVRHQKLKMSSRYDWDDRTYSLNENSLVSDLNALWVARQLCPDEVTRAEVHPFPALPLAQAQALTQRLSSLEVVMPRLAIPFEQWGAFVTHGGWRQQLMERRRGLPEQRSIGQWIQSGISALAQQVGWERVDFQPSLAVARGEIPLASLALVRPLSIHRQSYELLVSQTNAEANIWRFELRNQAPGGMIPSDFSLRLLTEDLQTFPENEDMAPTAVDRLYVEVALETGEGIVWEVDPQPDNYDQEILRF